MIIMAKITKIEKGKLVGKGKLEKEEVRRLFSFCKTFDISNLTDADSAYVFDVRPEAIHWLDKKDKTICSSLYCDTAKGDLKIELGDSEEWMDKDFALGKWNELIDVVLKKAG